LINYDKNKNIGLYEDKKFFFQIQGISKRPGGIWGKNFFVFLQVYDNWHDYSIYKSKQNFLYGTGGVPVRENKKFRVSNAM
jgi:hypothetical protein